MKRRARPALVALLALACATFASGSLPAAHLGPDTAVAAKPNKTPPANGRPTPKPTAAPAPRDTPEATAKPTPKTTPGSTPKPTPRPTRSPDTDATPRPTQRPTPRATSETTVEATPKVTRRPAATRETEGGTGGAGGAGGAGTAGGPGRGSPAPSVGPTASNPPVEGAGAGTNEVAPTDESPRVLVAGTAFAAVIGLAAITAVLFRRRREAEAAPSVEPEPDEPALEPTLSLQLKLGDPLLLALEERPRRSGSPASPADPRGRARWLNGITPDPDAAPVEVKLRVLPPPGAAREEVVDDLPLGGYRAG